MNCVYILRSLKNNKFYIGSTNDFERRFEEHNRGCSKFTRENGPFEKVFIQEYNDIIEARKIEYKLKSFKNRKIIEKIIKDKVIKTLTS
ncbi:MAG: GIY-YIG nuclease family protein [Patescibacteria group bacterium]